MSSPEARRHAHNFVDLTGQRFSRWIVIAEGIGWRKWLCRCDCGVEREVYSGALRGGKTLSCGCLKVEAVARAKTRHGHNRKGARSKEYRAWRGMIARCRYPSNQNFARYGARGIRVHPAWEADFEAFLRDVGPAPSPRHSLERIDNARGYEPGNVGWATPKEQARNTRRNVRLTHDGRTMTVVEWAEETGIDHETISYRLRSGLSAADVLTRPVRSLSPNTLTHDGETLSLREWEARTGIPYQTMVSRISRGWSDSDVVTIRPGGKRSG